MKDDPGYVTRKDTVTISPVYRASLALALRPPCCRIMTIPAAILLATCQPWKDAPTILSHLPVPDLALLDASLSWNVLRDLFWLHRNTPRCPGFCLFPDWMDIEKFLSPAHIENIFVVPNIFLLLGQLEYLYHGY